MTRIESNIDEVIRWYESRLPRQRVQTLTVDNEAPYAAELHARQGFAVTNDAVLKAAAYESTYDRLEAVAARGEVFTDADHAAALGEAGDSTVGYYQAVIGTKDTPGTVRPPPRPAHYEGWATDTGTLVNSWGVRINGGERKTFPKTE